MTLLLSGVTLLVLLTGVWTGGGWRYWPCSLTTAFHWRMTTGPGNHPPVLLVHGTAAALWGRVLEALAPYRVISYARRGFDGSTGPRPTSLHDHVADAVALLDDLAVPSCVVVGWSIGGVLALDLALTAPNRVTGLVLIEPPWRVSRALSLRLVRGPVAAMIRGRRDPFHRRRVVPALGAAGCLGC